MVPAVATTTTRLTPDDYFAAAMAILASDGVAGLTQDAVAPGGRFEYDFAVPDSGTYWYHAHNRSWNQVARGLFGPLVVEEERPAFDREHDVTLVLSDWLLDETGVFHEASMGAMMHWSHAGRLGNWLTVNGQSMPDIPFRAGEWYLLRLVNASSSRVLDIDPARFGARIVAWDGQALAAPRENAGIVQLAPAQRMDVVMRHDEPGTVPFELMTGEAYRFARFVVGEGTASPATAPLPARNGLPEPDLASARRTLLTMNGGAMGNIDGLVHRGEEMTRDRVVETRQFWGLNGIAGMSEAPLFSARLGETVLVESLNDTAFAHAMHLHGHHFRVLERNGVTEADPDWRDTFLAEPGERTTIAFVADNPGKWLIHCHMLEHAAAGMTNWFEVT